MIVVRTGTAEVVWQAGLIEGQHAKMGTAYLDLEEQGRINFDVMLEVGTGDLVLVMPGEERIGLRVPLKALWQQVLDAWLDDGQQIGAVDNGKGKDEEPRGEGDEEPRGEGDEASDEGEGDEGEGEADRAESR